MTKYGKSKNGHQFWKCKSCKRKHIFKRKDITEKSWKKRNEDVLLGDKRIAEYKCSRRTFDRHTKIFNLCRINLPPVTKTYNQIFLDAIKFDIAWLQELKKVLFYLNFAQLNLVKLECIF